MIDLIGWFIVGLIWGFGLGVWCCNRLVKRATAKVVRVLEQNQEFLDTWEPKRGTVTIRIEKDYR